MGQRGVIGGGILRRRRRRSISPTLRRVVQALAQGNIGKPGALA